jgi:GDSL-like Lipase/Acylhydrolase family
VSKRNRRRNRGVQWLSPRPVSYGMNNLGHVVLLGDSIIDNEHYTEGKPDVAQRLHSILGDDWKVTLLARDGATTGSLGYQVKDIPEDATHLFLSIGGNDALGESKILRDTELRTMRETLDELSIMAEMFAWAYSDAVTPLVETGIPLTICSVYDCSFPEGEKYPTLTALALFNDQIIRFAFANGLPVLDLRTVCTQPEDFELQIEPSAVGGAKIAAAIAGCLE